MAKFTTKYGFSAVRKFGGKEYHFTGDIYKTKSQAAKAAKAYIGKFGGFARIIRVRQGYVVFARYQSIGLVEY